MSFSGGDALLEYRAAYEGDGAPPPPPPNAFFHVLRVDSFGGTGGLFPQSTAAPILNGSLSLPVNPPSPFNREEVGYAWPAPGALNLPGAQIPNAGLYALMVSDASNFPLEPLHTRYAYFVARRRTAQTKVLVVFPFSTLAAYAGGKPDAHLNLYDSFDARRLRQVSLARPFDAWPNDSKEIPCVQFPHRLLSFLTTSALGPGLSASEIDVCTSFDLHGDPNVLDGIDLVILVGHDEYWTKAMRDAIEGFVAGGGNVLVLSANTAWWQVRLDLTERIMRCAKAALEDPYALAQYEEVTTNFCAVPAAGIAGGGFSHREENTLTGVSYRRGVQGPVAGQYTVAVLKAPYFDDTQLAVGDTFGSSTLFDLETDAADYTMQGGAPVLTGRDGTPTNFEILAYADLTDAASAKQRGKATMGLFTNVGRVFNVASTHWAKLLDTDAHVSRITKNAVTELRTRVASPAMDLPAREYPGDAFSQIGDALSGVTPALAGVVQGQLLLLRDGANRVMDPENPSAGEEAPPAITTLANATCYGADLWGRFVHAGTSAGTVHYHTGRIFAPGQAWTAWTANAGEPILGIASHNGLPYLVTRPAAGAPTTLRLMKPGGAELTTLGRVYPPLRAVTSLDGVLYGLHDTGTDVTSAVRVYARLASASDAVWTYVFDAPPGAYAIAAYYGRIYALAGGPGTSGPTLHWRAAVPDAATPYAPPRMLFVNVLSYAIGTLSYDGTYTNVKSGTLPRITTKVCRANGNRVFLYGAYGDASLVSFDAAGDVTEDKAWSANAFGAWDLIVPIRCTYNKDWKDPAQLDVTEKVLFYRQSTGASSIGSFASDGTYVQDTAPAFSSGWTHITCTHEGSIVFYNAASGAVEIGKIDDAGVWHGTGSATIDAGWQELGTTGQTWVVLKKTVTVPNNPAKAKYELREVLNGAIGASPLVSDEVAGEEVYGLAPVVNGVQLLYSPSDGKAAFVGWRTGTLVGAPVVPPDPPQPIPETQPNDARVVLRRYPTGFASGWTQIISLGAS